LGDKVQQLKAQLAGAAAQKAQRVVQDKPGAAVGAALTVVGLLILRWRQRRRYRDKKAQQIRGRSRTSRARRWARVLAALGFVIRRRRRHGRKEDS
jgi:ABC-type Fe3+ transport system permease subunit